MNINLITLLGVAITLLRQSTTNRKLTKLMAQTDDLNAGLDQLDADTKALADAQTQAFTDLEAAIAAGKTGTDLTPFITRLQTNHTAMTAALAAAQAADDTTKTPPPAQ